MESILILLFYLFGFLMAVLAILIGLSFSNRLREEYRFIGWLHRKWILLLVVFVVVSALWASAGVWKEFKSKEGSSGTTTSQTPPGSTQQIPPSPLVTGIETVMVVPPPDTVRDTLTIVDTIPVVSPPDTLLLPGPETSIKIEEKVAETTRLIILDLMPWGNCELSDSVLVEVGCNEEVIKKYIMLPDLIPIRIPTYSVNVTVRVTGKDIEKLERTRTCYENSSDTTWQIKLICKGNR